ncbi:hypothetical protein PMKS-002671 [Pichia membranifaciens]|uniref:PCI domain-containing protein n=1 Tax=Pichia membranifaciens TaxID=4926 RepID=A0A1Q2YI15_9ASCO|nr:hypothetical protein PMKS-002671 [Pichia membranifaciens]
MQQGYTLVTFFSDLDATINQKGQRRTFEELFSINFVKYDASRIASLQLEIYQLSDKEISSLIDNNPTVKRISWPAFENFVLNYLICIRDLDPSSVIRSIDLMIAVFECQSILFNPKSAFHDQICKQAIPYFEESMALMIPLSKFIDIESMHIHNRNSDYPRLTHISTILLKALNNIRSTPDLNDKLNVDKINLLFHISTNLCNVYYKIGSPILCANVFSNVNILNLNRRYINLSSLVTFRFIMGKYYAHQSNFMVSFHHLSACLKSITIDNCPMSNILIILKYIIPVGLIVGKVADISRIKAWLLDNGAQNNDEASKLNALLNIYEPLAYNYKVGNFYGVYKCISDNEAYWKHIGLWIPMLQRLRIPIFRNLAHLLWKMNGGNLTSGMLKTGLRVSMQGMETLSTAYQVKEDNYLEVDDLFVDNILASIVFNGFLKMKMNADRTLYFSKNDIFPDMYTVLSGRFPTNPREAWLDN